MKSIIRLSREDHACLRDLVQGEQPGGRLNADQTLNLEAVLNVAQTGGSPAQLIDHVGLEDRITLVSPTDRGDVFVLSIVVPSGEDIDADRIGIGKPVALACLGRRRNELVIWTGPQGIRAMKVVEIEKAVTPADVH
ncbi:GreA/GreB family elongation factor [Luteolibacter marinus]|uniref:GreA/GreB family elongation factor n=1 Tax=Luteolibacter marinus TaxID=2776705 RepID=UPI0018685455|nr:GreA/GreB family elongation factor [Luteolibacter marinus]